MKDDADQVVALLSLQLLLRQLVIVVVFIHEDIV
jgi:hypothetical protein